MRDLQDCESPCPSVHRSALCTELERRLRAGEPARAEDFFAIFPELPADSQTLLDLISTEIAVRRELRDQALVAEYTRRFPDLTETLRGRYLSPQTGAPAPGQSRLDGGRYVLLEEIGQGGQGVIHLAWQTDLRRLVALKGNRAGPLADPVGCARLQTEGESLARLQHPNVIQIYEVSQQEDRPCLVLEYMDGGTLTARLAGQPQPPHEAALLMETLARAVQHIHLQGIVHRDLNPANILLTGDGTPKISDFGLARLVVGASDDLTPDHAILGTPGYLAPEQVVGASSEVGPAADVFALGAILYECLTGRPPFQAKTLLETLRQVTGGRTLPPRLLRPDLPRTLEAICLKCLRPEPQDRYPSAETLAEDLHRFHTGQLSEGDSGTPSALARLIFKISS